jgi:transposase
MPVAPDTLPDDIEALKALLRQRDGELQQLRDTVSTLEQALSVRSLEIEQLETRLEDLLAEESESQDREATSAAPTAKQKSSRQSLPAHLPREERVLEPAEQACPSCGGDLKPLGEDVSEQLDLIDAAFKVIRHIRHKKACACCDVIVQAPAPSRPIERGIAAPGLLAHILVSKFADHQPLYRQSAIYARAGVDLDRSTMARWIGACGALLRPLVEALRRYDLAPVPRTAEID